MTTSTSRRHGTIVTMILTTIVASSGGCFRQPEQRTIEDLDPLRIAVRDQWIVDQYGRVLLFHGFNSVMKGPPWYDGNILNETRLKFYQDWGFNAVRLGTMWSGVEPRENRTNSTYMAIMETIVRKLGAHGMYALLDLHQDVASSKFGPEGYDGFPLWLVNKMPPPQHPYPWPFPELPDWAEGYLTQAASQVFQNLYSNVSGTMDDLVRFWQTVVRTFKSHSNVLGYELMNEPWVGDIYSDSELLLPANAGRKNLMPMYDIINGAIRAIDEKSLIFYEPATFGVFLNGEYTGTGFSKVPGGQAFANRSVLSYHYYCWLLGNAGLTNASYPALERIFCDDLLGATVFNNILDDLGQTGGGSFLTEFGLCEPTRQPGSIGTIECEFIMEKADEHFQSWTYWDSEFLGEDGTVRWEVVKPFVRAYARAIAGTPVATSFSVATAEFTLTYSVNEGIGQPTEIFVPELQYPKGFEVQVSKGLQWTFDQKNRVLKVDRKVEFRSAVDGTATVNIRRKES